MNETLTGRDYYIHHGYDELPEAVRIEMRRVFDTGVNNSGVWVRYKEVENLAGVMAYEYTHRPAPTVDTVKHGRWIEHHEPFTWMGYTTWTCSGCGYECGYEKEIRYTTPCCPNCGAKMDEVE